jgi:hypothetical protein
MFTNTAGRPQRGALPRIMAVVAFSVAASTSICLGQAPPSGFNVIVQGQDTWQLINNPDDFNWIPDPQGGGTVEQVQTSEGTDWEGGFDGTGFAAGSTSVFGNFSFTNTSGSTQTFTVTVISPLLQPISGQTQIQGSIGGSLVDTGPGAGATVAAPSGGSIYTALIDGNPVRTLMDDPFSFSVPENQADSIPSQSFPFEPGPIGAFNDIAIQHTFTLTAGDSVTFSSAFTVVPSPAGLAIFAAAGLLGCRRRRTR